MAAQTRGQRSQSGFRGVYACVWRPGIFRASIKVNRKTIHLGCSRDPEALARRYDVAAYEHFGEFARLNFERVQEPGYA